MQSMNWTMQGVFDPVKLRAIRLYVGCVQIPDMTFKMSVKLEEVQDLSKTSAYPSLCIIKMSNSIKFTFTHQTSGGGKHITDASACPSLSRAVISDFIEIVPI